MTHIPTRRTLLLGSAAVTAFMVSGCESLPEIIVNTILPEAPPYPFEEPAHVRAKAQEISDKLAAFIDDWLDHGGPSDLPDDLIPPGADPVPTNLRLVKADDLDPHTQWSIREGHEIDWDNSPGLYPDPHCTYLIAVPFFLPFGAKALLEGSFPYARFFSIQVTPPFDPSYYYYGTAFGAPEVPLVDVDIDPVASHTNPFRLGSDRMARRRDYRVSLEMVAGYGPAVEPAYRPPHFRAPGNARKGSGIVYQGPMGLPEYKLGHGRGLWDFGALWLRYYAPDTGRGPLAGVPLPRLVYETASGRRFGLIADIEAKTAETNKSGPIARSQPEEPKWDLPGPAIAWSRELDILHSGLTGIFQATGKSSPADKAQGKALMKGLVARGSDVKAPGPWQGSASRVPFISYLAGGGSLGEDQVLVLSGRLPNHPKTRDGNPRMEGGQVRYMSLTSYVVADFLSGGLVGQPVTSLMDEDIITDKDGNYLICYSRGENRPANARPAFGVTWVDWGPIGAANFTLRWLTVDGGWKDKKIAPDDTKVSYAQASWFDENYDQSLVGLNGRSAVMGPYLPAYRYMTKNQFEGLGRRPNVTSMPLWTG
jgi:hypothetical protein